MSSWIEIVGNYPTIQSNKTLSVLTKFLYKTVLKERSNILNECTLLSANFDDPHKNSLSFEEENILDNADKKSKKVPTYKITSPVYDEEVKDGKKIRKKTDRTEQIDKKKSKWLIMSGELKYVLVFWLARFTREIESFYNSRDRTMPEDSEVVSELVDFCRDPEDLIACITPFIMVVTDKIDLGNIMPVVFEDLDSYLHKTFSSIFKSDNGTPNKQLSILIDRWVSFMKIIAINFARTLWHSKRKGDEALLFTVLRNLSLVANGEAELEEATFGQMVEYIQESKRLVEEGKQKRKQTKQDTADKMPAPAETTNEDEFSAAMNDADTEDADFNMENATANLMEDDDWKDEDPFADDDF